MGIVKNRPDRGEENLKELRDRLAGEALQGMLASGIKAKRHPPSDTDLAETAYALADAMIEARGENEASTSNSDNH